MELFQGLNPAQEEAVTHLSGPILILAGAGSGKTRVITTRFAWLLRDHGVGPEEILAVTFTNKAAGEMKERIARMTGTSGLPWVKTFHSAALQILRAEIGAVGGSPGFTVIDQGDQRTLVRECSQELGVNEEIYSAKTIASKISELKNLLLAPEDYARKAQSFGLQDKVAKVYALYQKKLSTRNLFDFDDLLFRLVDLFTRFPDVLNRYQERFRYIMVDEYQDTNHVQYRLISLLAARQRNLCCVGDDDQSIYGFRGADVQNILRFEKDYPDAKVIKLEQNYRSTGNILSAANGVIEHNSRRKRKRLWTENKRGEAIEIFRIENEEEESRLIAKTVRGLIQGREGAGPGLDFHDFSVLYRTHAQSRTFEEAFQKEGIPYRILGGLRFFERKEIKDMVAYLRLVVYPDDELSLKRIINFPHRGIGSATVEKLEESARQSRTSLRAAVGKGAEILSGQTGRSVTLLSDLLLDIRQKAPEMSLRDLVQFILDRTGIVEALRKEKAEDKIENLTEFYSSVADYRDGQALEVLPDYLDHIALFSGDDDKKEGKEVRLMTLHGAKGLEFPVVFMPGMEEGIFPHGRSQTSDLELEEERRLCYVGMTRARERLFLTGCRSRRIFGTLQFNSPSRFLNDIPVELARQKELYIEASLGLKRAPERSWGGGFSEPVKKSGGPFVHQNVIHPLWGRGVVLSREGEGDDQRVTVRFDAAGVKKIALKFANLKFL
ncbi:MAG TPA: UvrD-helicase domain-containing protein [Nitrospiria bacterium]|nr:UvrD-helicase domain-containing protein [Nitrospiria bacterium]